MAARTSNARHAAQPYRDSPIITATAKAITWMLTDHDDRVPNLVQTVVWFLALATLFVSTGLRW
jgi:hypothetical protein